MKKASILFIVCLTVVSVHGQGFFNQKGAWIKNQIKQIALWEIYIKDIEKGYEIARDGLGLIGSIKNGDFHLHLEHFNSLEQVNPAIKKYARVAEVLLMQYGIEKLYIKRDDDYVNAVFSQLIELAALDVEQVNRLLSPGNYAMTDDERIKCIDKLYAEMKDKYAFAKSFSNDVRMLSLHQVKEKNEVLSGRLLHNIKIP